MRRHLPAALILLSAAVPAPFAAAQPYQIVDSVTVHVGPFTRTDSTVQAGPDAVDRFVMHRLAETAGPPEPRRVLLLLGPLANPFRFFETDEDGIYARSFAAFFARQGYELWGYSPRGTGLVSGDCESGAVDCSPMAAWGLAAIVDDVAFIRDQIAAAHPGVQPVVIGYSLGGVATIATIDAHPGDYAAAVVFEGALYSEDPVVVALNAGYCADTEQDLANGILFDGGSLPLLRLLAILAIEDPDSPTPFPGFPPGFTNHQVLVFALAVPGVGPFWQTPNFVRCDGSVAEDRFFYCDDHRVLAHTLLFNDYFDLATIRDITCGLGGERAFTADLGAFAGPVYLLGGGLSFAAENVDLAHLLTGAASVTLDEVPEFGHADHWFTHRHRRYVEAKIARWLDQHP